MNYAFFVVEILGIIVIVSALLLLLKGDSSREQKLMQYFLIGSLIQNVGYLLEATAPTQEAAIVAVKMQYLGSLLVPICYCHFMFSYCYEKAPVKILRVLKAVDIFILCLVFTCDSHTLYYSSIAWKHTPDGHGYLHLDYGWGYWIFMLCGTIMPYALSLFALIRVCIRRPEYAADRKCKLMLLLSSLPVVTLASYALKLNYVYDFTPLVLGLVLSSVVILIWSRNVYDFSSIASGILLDSMSDGVIALDERQRIASYNPAAARTFKGLGGRMKGKHIALLENFPLELLHEEGNREFSLNNRFYQGRVERILDKNKKNKGYVVLILDVTKTRTYIEEIKRVREQAEEANIAKSAFLANMSHEIRTPMNAIVGLSDIIMEESRGRKVYEYACDIKSASGNLLALINDILDLSKVEAGKMELMPTEYHVKTLVNEVLNMMDIVASQRGLMLKSEYDMSLPCRYLGDEGRIKQILINLLNNAVKFTREGYVKITVAGRAGSAEDTELLSFRIEDTGCGIREEDLGKIFENFKQVDSKRNRTVEGTGLGLSITKHLVELMAGTIAVESVYGEGTVFTVEIPQTIMDTRPLTEVPEAETRKDEKLEPFYVEDFKALVVDDNLVNRKVARILLQSYGLEITEADSGPAAIELVRQTRYDIIFMDHMMPEMDGIEAVQIIRRECGENGSLPVVIALTANAMEGVRETFLANGFQDFITKPLDRRPLHEVLLKWIPQERRIASKEWLGLRQADSKRNLEFQTIYIEGIDTDEVLQRYSGGVEEFRELLRLYCLDGKRKLTLLRELWEKRDYKNYGIEVHGLKSASANVGAMKVSISAREQEYAINRGDETFVDSHVAELLEDYETQLQHIEDFLAGGSGSRSSENRSSGGEQDDGSEKERAPEKAELLREIGEALEQLENFRAKECAHMIEDILRYRLEPDTEARLREIQEQLSLYEDEAAEGLLRELMEQMEKGD
ncbi:MAG: ATP-binding protein [Roseburia sp.]|nr:ATP-binding protein [Roseburia sp.]